jgi:DUF4097 and DUF4098 domain-containing protein YvlB
MASPINPGTPALPPAPPAGGPPSSPRPPVPYRRRSIFSGLLLVIVGVLLLFATLRPGFSLGYVISHFWPVIIIIWGIAKLIDRYAVPSGAPPTAIVTGGELGLVFLLVALVCFVALIGWIHNRRGEFANHFGDFGMFTEHYSDTKRIDVKQVGDPKSLFSISTPNGAINVHTSAGNELLVVGNASAGGNSEQAARDRLKNLDLAFDGPDGNYQIHPVNASGNGISVDLDVQLPKAASINARTQHGDVTVADVQGPTDAATRGGDLQIHDVGAGVTADLQNGDAHIRNIAGPVSFTGRGGGDVEITDVQGDATLSGNVFGDVDLRNVAKGVHYSSPRANAQIAALPGELKIDNSDIVLSHGEGPITISAKNQDLRLDQIQGPLTLTETHGDINVTFTTPPNGPININNDSGDVTLNLPPRSNFSLYAQSNSGDITDDFAANPEHDDDHRPHIVNVTHGTGGPAIRVVTKYGDIHIGNSQ